ncbi:MAG: endo-1,4-beta-xylanase [Fibrobacter sp.]|nr:endo-1,4-beta-xylanase [Fibrobacter sp.]
MKKSVLSALVLIASMATVANAALADGGAKFLGNITTSGQVRGDMSTYWNQITPENGCKWGSIHSLSNGNSGTSQFAWDNYDKCEGAYKWAKENGAHFKFHALVWGSQYPNFLCKKKNPGITVELTKKYITEWFDAVAAKFPDLEYIDVVNEAIWAGNNYHSGYGKPAQGAEGRSTDDTECGGSYIIEALGGDRVVNGKHQYDFITTAFKMARERWPNAILIYNDYNTLSWQMNEGIELIQTILKNGAPVDVYGQQAHDCKGMSKSDFESKLTKIHNETGLPLVISEYDISEADDNKQKNDYANQIPFMWETEWIVGITIWGYINGSTWASNTGIIEKDGRKRAAMVWLEDYFAKNKDKGNSIELKANGSDIDYSKEVPQEPYNGTAFVIDMKDTIQAEHFDKAGEGKGNSSYYDVSPESNNGDADFRTNEGVDIYKGGVDMKGLVIGYTEPGDWLEYTVDFKRKGPYTIKAVVSSANETSSFKLYVDDVEITEEMFVPKTGESDWNTYQEIGGKVDSVSTGRHILKVESVGGWFNLDYIVFENIAPPEVIAKEDSAAKVNDTKNSDKKDPEALFKNIRLSSNSLTDYDVIDIRGARLGHISAKSTQQAAESMKLSNIVKTSGIYYIRSRATGKMQSLRIVK